MAEVNLERRRRYWESKGWKNPYEGEASNAQLAAVDLAVACSGLPPVESDNGLALQELMEFCEERKWAWDLYRFHDLSQYSCSLYSVGHNYVHEFGATPAEAIVKALIQAREAK